MNTITVLLCGVGGQGTILAADLLAKTAAASGLEVKISEIHGMSQRGGSVTTVVRMGSEVHSMVASLGSADIIVSFEAIEALRNLPYLKQGGVLFSNTQAIPSLPVRIGAATMPEHPDTDLLSAGAHLIDATGIALQAQNPRGTNVVLMGALSMSLPFEQSTWEDVISKRVPPKTIDANIAAFRAGRDNAGDIVAIEEG